MVEGFCSKEDLSGFSCKCWDLGDSNCGSLKSFPCPPYDPAFEEELVYEELRIVMVEVSTSHIVLELRRDSYVL